MNLPKVGIIVSTNRTNSLSSKIADYYADILKEANVGVEIITLNKLPHDFAFSALYENSEKNNVFNEFQKRIDELQKLIFIVPEYNGSFPGVLKTFLDGLRYPDTFNDKKVALVGISSGVLGNSVGLCHLNDILSYMGANVLGLRVKLGTINTHYENNGFNTPTYKEFIDKQVKKFIAF